jgi:Phage integrase family.
MTTYLTLHGATYHFRYFIPASLQPTIGRKVIKVSLKTGRKRLAKRKAGQLASAARKFLEKAKESESMDKQTLQRNLRTYLKYLVEMDDALRAAPVDIEDDATLSQFFLEKMQKGMTTADNKSIKPFVDEFLSMSGLEPIPTDSMEYHLLARQIHKILLQFAHVGKLRAEGDVIAEQEYLDKLFPDEAFVAQARPVAPPAPDPIPQPPVPEFEPEPMEELIRDFIKASEKTPETNVKYEFTIKEFMAISGAINIEKVNHPMMRHYVEVLQALPPNYSKNFPDRTVLEVAKLDHEKTVAARTVNDKIGIMGRFFRWAINQGYIENNFADGKRLPKGKPQKSTHEAWTLDDIQKMFDAPQYVKDSFRSPYQFWMIPLALYTGARQSELAQLRCEDLYVTDGLWCIRIHPDADDASSRVKTINAIRTIPLHPVLVEELKFPAFVEMVRKKGHNRIFPEIKPRQGKYGKVVSQWFNDRFKKKLDLQPPRAGFKKDFHSFRNTFIDAAKQARVPMEIIEETVGHASALGNRQQSMSGDYYASDYSERIRYEELMLKVEFAIDLTNPKKSKRFGGE